MDEARLREKLARIEALFAGATTDGERVAAGEARRRIQLRLDGLKQDDPPREFRMTVHDTWSRKVMLALLRRYGLEPYHYRGQRRTTVMVKAPVQFLNETLLPQYEQINEALHTYLGEVTDRVIAEMIHSDGSEASEVPSPPQLGSGEAGSGCGS